MNNSNQQHMKPILFISYNIYNIMYERGYRNDKKYIPQTFKKESAKGKKVPIVPGFVTKYVYREGEGNYPKLGNTVHVLVSCSLISGKQLIKRKESAQYIIGRKRLIKGLEVAFLRVRKNEKFTLVIAPQYAYGNSQHYDLVPKNSTLIYEMEIVDICRVDIGRKNEVEKYLEVHHVYGKVDRDLQRQKYDQAMQKLQFCYGILCGMNSYKSQFRVKSLIKWVNILIHLKKYNEALRVNEFFQKNDSHEEGYYHTIYKVKKIQGQLMDIKVLMQKFHDSFGSNDEQKRIYINYLKDIKDFRALRQLPHYDFANDKIKIPPPPKYNRDFYFMMPFRF